MIKVEKSDIVVRPCRATTRRRIADGRYFRQLALHDERRESVRKDILIEMTDLLDMNVVR